MIPDSLNSQFNTLEELVDSCIAFFKSTKSEMNFSNVRKRRVDLSACIEKFHRECGTLTAGVQKRLDDLKNGNCIVMMSAHQPNLFPYSGVLRKTTLIFVLAKQLEKRLNLPVINFFGIADQDFTDDRWVKSTSLPAVKRRDGVFSINISLPEKMILNRVPKPAPRLLNDWRMQIERWLREAVNSVDLLCKKYGSPIHDLKNDVLHKNFRSFWDIVEGCYDRSNSYSDFNAFVMSKIVNDAWGYDTLFSRFSESQQLFVEEINFILSRYQTYSASLKEAHERLIKQGVSSGVSAQENQLIPFWYHCDCGSKVRLFSVQHNGSLLGYGDCLGCNQSYELNFGSVDKPNVSHVASRISLRAISWILTFSKGLRVSSYVGGVGGLWYLIEVQYVAKKLGISLPPTPFWRPYDRYIGIKQLEALLEMKRIFTKFAVNNLTEAVDVLKSHLNEIRTCLDKLEASKSRAIENLSVHPNDERLNRKVRMASLIQTYIKKASNHSVLNHDLRLLENVSGVLNLIPSIIDYGVNIGLDETSHQWIQHLTQNGDLSSDVHLEPILNPNAGLNRCIPLNESSFILKT